MELETDRLILRPFKETDLDDFLDYTKDKDSLHFESFGYLNEEQLTKYFEFLVDTPIYTAIVLKENNKVIGNIYFTESGEGAFEIGYILHINYRHKGYAYEAVKAVIDEALLLGTHRIEATVNPENIDSLKLIERLGFKQEELLKEYKMNMLDENGNVIKSDMFLYGLINEVKVNDKTYFVSKLLGKGKNSYTYLALDEKKAPLAVKTRLTTNEIETNIKAFSELSKYDIRVPKIIEVDKEKGIILKEYISGESLLYLKINNLLMNYQIEETKKLASEVEKHGLILNYNPANFISSEDGIYYVHYEYKDYLEDLDFEHFGRVFLE